jgi:uncharacterized protein (DUF3084 family)
VVELSDQIVPDYLERIQDLEVKLAHKTKEVDRIEQKMGLQTRLNNQMVTEVENAKLAVTKMEAKVLDKDTTIKLLHDLVKSKEDTINSLYEQIKQLQALETARWFMEQGERELKRPRTD